MGRFDQGISLRREAYSECLNLYGEESSETLMEANNYVNCLLVLNRFEEAKSLLRKTMPVARRILGENHDDMLRMRGIYANALFSNPGATLDDLREAVTTLEETAPIARRVLGSAHPTVRSTEMGLQQSRARLEGYIKYFRVS